MRDHLRKLYDDKVKQLKSILDSTNSCALTTDIWTSRTTQGFLTLTCHFIDDNCVQKAFVLETVRLNDAHTGENIKNELEKITNKWSITDKVVCTTTDSGSNIVLAIQLTKWKHLHCFAHTLNLVVQSSIDDDSLLSTIKKKCKEVVAYFHRSVKAADKLATIQERLNLPQHKLIQDVETRWNSTFFMFQRIIEQHEALTTTLCLLDRSDLCLMNEMNENLKEAVTLLQPFEIVTREVSSEEYISISKLIPLAKSLQQLTCSNTSELELGSKLRAQMQHRFRNIEGNHLLAAATFLDPRFKKMAFNTPGAAQHIEQYLTEEMKSIETQSSDNSEIVNEAETTSAQDQENACSIWESFDEKVNHQLTHHTPTSDAIIETKQYLLLKNLGRKEDPLEWWKTHRQLYPRLFQLATKYLCIPGTSVPAERLFSKAGELISIKRNRIKEKNVDMLLFLNKNL